MSLATYYGELVVRRRARALRWGKFSLFLGLGLGLAAAVDLENLVDRFYEQRVERLALGVWARRAVALDYDGCLKDARSCLGRIVHWPVAVRAEGASFYGDSPARRILWLNEKQLPNARDLQAIALVRRIGLEGVTLLYVGTLEAAYGGTTTTRRFGYEEAR